MNNFMAFIGQHWLLAALFIILFTAVIVFESISAQKNDTTVSPQEAIQLMNRENAIVVDVRSKDAFSRGHIINAFHLPLSDLSKDIKKITQHKKRPVIVACGQGTESVKAAKMISDQEFEAVKILKGGVAAWRAEKLPLEGS